MGAVVAPVLVIVNPDVLTPALQVTVAASADVQSIWPPLDATPDHTGAPLPAATSTLPAVPAAVPLSVFASDQ